MKNKNDIKENKTNNNLIKYSEMIDFDFFSVLFEPVRLELLKYLADNGVQSITEIAENFDQDRSVISRHLDQMYRQGIVTKTKQSRYIYYKLDCKLILEKLDENTEQIREILNEY